MIHLFWNTLRRTRRNYDNRERKFYKNNFLYKGITLVTILTTRCPLKCSYCPMALEGTKLKFDECSLEEWKNYITYFPEWMSYVIVSGGEPTLVPYLSEYLNFLTGRGHHVMVFTTLWRPEAFYGVKKTFKLVVVPTFHRTQDTIERFENARKKLDGIVRVLPCEFGNNEIDGSQHKEFFDDEFWYVRDNLLHTAPDTPRTKRLFHGCTPAYKSGK